LIALQNVNDAHLAPQLKGTGETAACCSLRSDATI
jgi:hypothetical protein